MIFRWTDRGPKSGVNKSRKGPKAGTEKKKCANK
jgi:hypothetical protein